MWYLLKNFNRENLIGNNIVIYEPKQKIDLIKIWILMIKNTVQSRVLIPKYFINKKEEN
jgi:hypothetical protein